MKSKIENLENVKRLPFVEWTESQFRNTPNIPAVYFLCTNKRVLYIGYSKTLHNRMLTNTLIRKYMAFRGIKLYWFESCYPEDEGKFIKKLQPMLNKQGKKPIIYRASNLYAFEICK